MQSWTRKDFGEFTLFEEEPMACDSITSSTTNSTGTCYQVVRRASLGNMYISALYFSYATLTTVGYGDISATTTWERGVALIALSIGSAIFAGIVGTMSTLVDSMDELEEVRACDSRSDALRKRVSSGTDNSVCKKFVSNFKMFLNQHTLPPIQLATLVAAQAEQAAAHSAVHQGSPLP